MYALNIIVGLFIISRKSLIRTLTVHHSVLHHQFNLSLPATVRQEFNCGVYYFQNTITQIIKEGKSKFGTLVTSPLLLVFPNLLMICVIIFLSWYYHMVYSLLWNVFASLRYKFSVHVCLFFCFC